MIAATSSCIRLHPLVSHAPWERQLASPPHACPPTWWRPIHWLWEVSWLDPRWHHNGEAVGPRRTRIVVVGPGKERQQTEQQSKSARSSLDSVIKPQGACNKLGGYLCGGHTTGPVGAMPQPQCDCKGHLKINTSRQCQPCNCGAYIVNWYTTSSPAMTVVGTAARLTPTSTGSCMDVQTSDSKETHVVCLEKTAAAQ